MAIGISEEHEALREVARRWVEQHVPPSEARRHLDAERDTVPQYWSALAAPGWLGLHVAETSGGLGYSLEELVVVLEELGYAVAPGPFVPAVLTSAVIEAAAPVDGPARALLPTMVTGAAIGTIALGDARLDVDDGPDGARLRGTLRPVVCGHLASHLVVAARADGSRGGDRWFVVAADAAGVATRELPSLDPTRRVAEVVFTDVSALDELDPGAGAVAARLAAVMFSAELVGLGQWTVDEAAAYAKVREQFGRPIGQFQGVKHKCADMVARTELARAAVWDAARAAGDAEDGPFTAAVGAALTLDAATADAKDCIQIFGGIGFTWEHDAHLRLRRALATSSLLGGSAPWRLDVARRALAGTRRRLAVDLPPEAESHRVAVRAVLDEIEPLDDKGRRSRLAELGYVAPPWPEPWGRDASALEQIVIEEEFRQRRIRRPRLTIGAWALPNLILYGTPEQQARWILPSLKGDMEWCQLFSEPGAGSDLAALTTRAEKVAGGWLVNGQKVWTSMADLADWGILLARTDPDAPKHEGISCFMLDMTHTPGIDIRPLREITGHAFFNEVFFTDVFIPDDCLVGEENDGWRAARTTLANERVFMSGGSTMGFGLEGLVRLLVARGLDDDRLLLDEVGGLVAEAHGLAVLGFRLTLQALSGADPSGSAASVRKLLGVLHDQHVQSLGLELLGPDAAVDDGDGAVWINGFMFSRAVTIAGGTSEIQRNIIAERVLGLPRDP